MIRGANISLCKIMISSPHDTISDRSRLSPSARRFYEIFNSLQFIGSLVLLWYTSQVLFYWARCENCCCSASCSSGSSHCHFPNYYNSDEDMGDPTRALISALFVISLVQLLGGYLCACNIGLVRCIVAFCSAAALFYGFRRATQLEWLVCRPVPDPVGNNDNWKKVAWNDSSHGKNCVLILSGHGAIVAADCILTCVFCFFNAAAFNPREQVLVAEQAREEHSAKQKSD